MGNINYEVLEYLRNTTRLTIKEKLELYLLEKERIELFREFNKVEHSSLGVDFKDIDELEYKMRFNRLQRNLCGLYLEHGCDVGLAEFTHKVIHDDMEAKRNKTLEMKK